MKTKTIYICEICKTEFETEEEAKQCENIGKPEVNFKENYTITIVQGRNVGQRAKIFSIYYMSPNFSPKPHEIILAVELLTGRDAGLCTNVLLRDVIVHGEV